MKTKKQNWFKRNWVYLAVLPVWYGLITTISRIDSPSFWFGDLLNSFFFGLFVFIGLFGGIALIRRAFKEKKKSKIKRWFNGLLGFFTLAWMVFITFLITSIGRGGSSW